MKGPKPISRGPRKMEVYTSVWAVKRGRHYWTYLDGEKIYFHSSNEARELAKKMKFDGIHITIHDPREE